MISVATLPPVATASGNKNSSFSMGLRGGCHCCHPFLKKRKRENRTRTMQQNRRTSKQVATVATVATPRTHLQLVPAPPAPRLTSGSICHVVS